MNSSTSACQILGADVNISCDQVAVWYLLFPQVWSQGPPDPFPSTYTQTILDENALGDLGRFLKGFMLNSALNAYPLRPHFPYHPSVTPRRGVFSSTTVARIRFAAWVLPSTNPVQLDWAGLSPDGWISRAIDFGSEDVYWTCSLVRKDCRSCHSHLPRILAAQSSSKAPCEFYI